MQVKYWQILLIKQRERGKDGLSIPFIIGSQQYLPTDILRQNVLDLCHDITTAGMFETCIRYCMNITTLIFEIRKERNAVYYPTFNGLFQKNLSVSIASKDDLGESVEQLMSVLETRFQKELDDGLYSAISVYGRDPSWSKFTDEDELFIINSFKSVGLL